MTQFSFWLENHSDMGQRSLEDVIGIMGHQLRALGHRAVWDINNRGAFVPQESGINVIVEGFTPQLVEVLARCHAQGIRFLILATEEPTEKGFNHGTQPEMVRRQKVFPEAAKYCEGILHLVPGEHITRWYSQFAPAAYAELGYARTLVRGNDIKPDFEFGFYGSMTARRLRILKRLANATNSVNAVKLMTDFKTQAERDAAMRRAKVIVQVRKFEEMGLVSSSRCNTALCLGRPVVAEPHLLSKPWDEVVRFTESLEGFISTCLMVRAAWRGVWATQFERFKQKLTPEVCVGEPLRKIGLNVSPERLSA
jgi:hypothetical protein